MMVSSLPSDYLWENLSYYQIPLHRDSGFYNILLLTLNVSQDIEESIMQQFQCRGNHPNGSGAAKRPPGLSKIFI